jgi:hypothetical protein
MSKEHKVQDKINNMAHKHEKMVADEHKLAQVRPEQANSRRL